MEEDLELRMCNYQSWYRFGLRKIVFDLSLRVAWEERDELESPNSGVASIIFYPRKYYNRIEFWHLPFTSRRSKDDFWIPQHRLPNPQPVPKKHAINLNQKWAISFSVFFYFYKVMLIKARINRKKSPFLI